MKIKDIEIIRIYPQLASRYEHRKVDLYGIDCRVVYKIKADNGLIGYGDVRVRPNFVADEEVVSRRIGTNPFEHVHNTYDIGLGGALYDLMGKYAEQPAYALMGKKVRDQVSMAAWTRPASPADFASEISRAAAQGYTRFKMHSCRWLVGLELTAAAAEVAPTASRFTGTLTAAVPWRRCCR